MIITKLEKKKRLYLMEVDNQDSLYITEDTIVRFMLSRQKEITSQELEEIRHFAQLSYGKNLALYYISFKQRTQKEVQTYLEKYEIDPTIIPEILQHLISENWINDQTYTENFLYHNQLSGDKGPQALQQKLSQKGIPKTIITEQLMTCDFSEIAQRVSQKLLRKYQHKLPQRALQDKILQNMMTKGFTYQQALEAFSQLHIESDQELEEELLQKELDKYYRKYSRKYDGYDLKQRLTQALARKGYDYYTIQTALRDYL